MNTIENNKENMSSIDDHPIIEISQDNNVREQLKFHNSANFLCNFMRKQEYLISDLKDMALKPRYFEERIEYLEIPGRPTITFPMTCFCDIPLSKASTHMEEYGQFGIALNKSYCMQKDVQPIMYINKNARILKDIAFAFQRLFSSEELNSELAFLADALLSQLLYTKPIEGDMRRNDDTSKHLLFKDECEWRYIPEMPIDMPLILPLRHNTDKGRKAYSDALGKVKKTWFRFDTDSVEYIIAPTEADALSIIEAIIKMRNKNNTEKHKLISKIEIADKFGLNLI